MIQREGWNHSLICDHCEDSKDGFEEFDEAVKYKKRNGWKSVQSTRGAWFEFCPKCSTPEIIQKYREK